MRMLVCVLLAGSVYAQVNPAPVEPAASPAVPVVAVDTPPLQPPDPATPYASPRDAARHRFQATLAELEAKRDVPAAIRGFAEALASDRTYAAAAFNLGILAAIGQKWDDAVAALQETSRLDPSGLGTLAAPQLERLRLVASLEKSEDGQRQRRYDEALLPLLAKLPKLPPADAQVALTEVGRIDPRRWEAPALLASLNGSAQRYDVAAKFLEIAATSATDPAVKASLTKALQAAQRELRYAAARTAAEAAADRGDHAKAAELFEAAWTTVPARSMNGLDAASAYLLQDDTTRATTLLTRLRESGDTKLVASAEAMLKQLEALNTAAKEVPGQKGEFFKDRGSAEPVVIATMLPPIDRRAMEVLARPLPKLAWDPEPVVLLSSLAADPTDPAASAGLPPLAAPTLAGESPWAEVQAAWARSAAAVAPEPQERSVESADLAGQTRTPRMLAVTSQPPGAQVLVGDGTESLCRTPCEIRIEAGTHVVRLRMAGYQDAMREVRVAGKQAEVAVPLALIRGNVLVEASGVSVVKVNGTAAATTGPVELSLVPGLHRIRVEAGGAVQERTLMVKPGARLRLATGP